MGVLIVDEAEWDAIMDTEIDLRHELESGAVRDVIHVWED